MRDPRRCKQCGYQIIPNEKIMEQGPQTRGFCTRGCEDVYEEIKLMYKIEADKEIEKELKNER